MMRDAEFRERVEAVKERVTPSDLIGRKVPLKRHGHEFTGLCPFHNEKSPSFTVNNRKLFFHCFGCGAHGDVIAFVMRFSNIEFMAALELLESEAGLQRFVTAAAPVRAELSEDVKRQRAEREQRDRDDEARKHRRMQEIWASRQAIAAGGPVDRYLRGRALVPPAEYGVGVASVNAGWPGELGFAPALWHPYARREMPAMVAAIRSAAGELWAVHQTYLVQADRGHWTKASFTEKHWSKLVLGTYVFEAGPERNVGGRIVLGPFEPSMTGGEGIETSLSAMQIWRRSGLAFVTSGNMPNVELPFPCAHFLYAADKDPKRIGERKAWQAAKLQANGRRVEVMVPRLQDAKCDFNDVLMRRAAAQGRAA